jgi:hypothetical protein
VLQVSRISKPETRTAFLWFLVSGFWFLVSGFLHLVGLRRSLVSRIETKAAISRAGKLASKPQRPRRVPNQHDAESVAEGREDGVTRPILATTGSGSAILKMIHDAGVAEATRKSCPSTDPTAAERRHLRSPMRSALGLPTHGKKEGEPRSGDIPPPCVYRCQENHCPRMK